MKKLITMVAALLFSAAINAQQWDGINNFTDPISREGRVSIGNPLVDNSLTDILYLYGNQYFFGNNKIVFKLPGAKGGQNISILRSSNGLNFFSDGYNGGFYNRQILYMAKSAEIGIGTVNVDCSTCTGYRLFVKDGIKTEKVKVEIAASNGWADYVFKKDYKLMPLNTLEEFINANGHLPEVPTAEQAIADGIELKSMNILLLKKVEELTLHAIEQNKRIEALEKRINK